MTGMIRSTVFLAALTGLWLTAPTGAAETATVVNGVRYDVVGIVSSLGVGALTINGQVYPLGAVAGARNGAKRHAMVPLSAIQPGSYVGVILGRSPRGEPVVNDVTLLPQ